MTTAWVSMSAWAARAAARLRLAGASRAATSAAMGRACGSREVMAPSNLPRGSGRWSGTTGSCVRRARAASVGVPPKAGAPVISSSRTSPRA